MKRIGTGATLLAITTLLGACGAGSPALRQDDGRLAPCPDAPHCVSSQASDEDRRVAPILYAGSREQARGRLVKVLREMPRCEVVTAGPDYVHAEFTSPLLRFVDDVEFLLPASAPRIDVRSSSRIGYYDFGANRARVERVREAFAAEQ